MRYSKNITSKLNDLLTKNYDAEAGFNLAAEKVNNRDLKDFFIKKAQSRNEFGHELKNEITTYGESPDKGTSIKGDAHRGWMNLKTAFSDNNEEAILEETIKGEKKAVEEYNEILKEENMPSTTMNVLEMQRNNIQTTLQEVKRFESVVS